MVGARGFEPPASCSRSRRSTGLSHAPFAICLKKYHNFILRQEKDSRRLKCRNSLIYGIVQIKNFNQLRLHKNADHMIVGIGELQIAVGLAQTLQKRG